MPYPGPSMNPDLNPNAPRIAEVPVMSNEEGIDIEEEMLCAAIEASKREAEEASRRAADPSQDITEGSLAERFPVVRSTKYDDLPHPVTLSLKTMEQEKAMREHVGASSESVFMHEDEDNPSVEDIKRLDKYEKKIYFSLSEVLCISLYEAYDPPTDMEPTPEAVLDSRAGWETRHRKERTKERLNHPMRAKAHGLVVLVETCPQYLAFTVEEIGQADTCFKCAPPVRDAPNHEKLWQALKDGSIDLLSSDHSPAPPKMKEMDLGDFLKAWGGISSLQVLEIKEFQPLVHSVP